MAHMPPRSRGLFLSLIYAPTFPAANGDQAAASTARSVSTRADMHSWSEVAAATVAA